MQDLLRAPLTLLTAKLASREVSAVELMQATLSRIEETQDRVNAFVTLRDPDALLADAAEADARFERGEPRALEANRFEDARPRQSWPVL